MNINYGLLGGGVSQLLAPHGNLTNVNVLDPYGSGIYNSLQATLNRWFSGGSTFQSAYTYSKHIERLTSVRIPEYLSMNRAKSGADRTHHYVLSGTYELPFGRGKQMAQDGVGAAILSGWALSGIFNVWSGAPFNVTASGNSCNCPFNTQIADQVKPEVAIISSAGAYPTILTSIRRPLRR